MLYDGISRDALAAQRLESLKRDYDAQPRRRRLWAQRPEARSPGRTGEGAQCGGLTLATTLPAHGRSRLGA